MQRGAGRDDIGPFQRDPHGKNQPLCRGLEVTAAPTTSGVDATRPPLDRAAAITRSLLGDGVLAGVCYLVVGLMQARTHDGDDPIHQHPSPARHRPRRLEPARQFHSDGAAGDRGRSPDLPAATRPPRKEQPMTTQAAPPAATSRLRALLPTLLDLVIHTAGYFLLHWAGLPDIWALTIAGAATGVNALVTTIRRGRLDALGLLVVAEVGVSVVLVAVTADPRLILARPAVYLAVARVVNLGSWFARRPVLRALHRQLTGGIGLAMLAYAVIRVLIVYSFPTGTALLVQEVPGIL